MYEQVRIFILFIQLNPVTLVHEVNSMDAARCPATIITFDNRDHGTGSVYGCVAGAGLSYVEMGDRLPA